MKSFTSKERKELLKRWNESRRRSSSVSSTLLRDGDGKEDDRSHRVPREKRNAATGPSMKRREGNVGGVGETSAAVESSFEKTDFARRHPPSNDARHLNTKNNVTRRFNEECEENVDE